MGKSLKMGKPRSMPKKSGDNFCGKLKCGRPSKPRSRTSPLRGGNSRKKIYPGPGRSPRSDWPPQIRERKQGAGGRDLDIESDQITGGKEQPRNPPAKISNQKHVAHRSFCGVEVGRAKRPPHRKTTDRRSCGMNSKTTMRKLGGLGRA